MRTYVLPDNVTVLNQPKHICKSQQGHSSPRPANKEPDIFLLVVVTSAMPHYHRRMAIRETWGNETNNKILARRFQNLTDHFANVNMTETLFSELGYSSNVSLEDKKDRYRRDVGAGRGLGQEKGEQEGDGEGEGEEETGDDDMVPMLDEGNQARNLVMDVTSPNISLDEDGTSLINNNGANSYRTYNEALVDDGREGSSSTYSLDMAKQFMYGYYNQLDRFISNYYKKYNTPHLRQERGVAATKPSRAKTSPLSGGDKRAIYDEAEENMDVDALGNFETTDDEPAEEVEQYDYQTEESNIMKIPRRGEENEDEESVKKALEDLKNTLQLSMKNDKLSLKYFSDKNSIGEKSSQDKYSKLNKNTADLKPKQQLGTKVQSKADDLGSKQNDYDNLKVKFLFLLGQSSNENDTELQNKVDEEVATYGDVIQESFIDSYNNLTLKSVMLLKWVITNCGDNVHYVMKTDDDMFVNIPRLLEALKNKSDDYNSKAVGSHHDYSNEKLLMGDLICDARPISDMRSKWYSPTYMYSGKVYPKYLSGVGYVMSLGAAKDLYQAALDTPLFHLEDIFITGMCSHKAGITPLDHSGFSYSARKYNLCVYMYMITAHQVTPTQMRQMYGMLVSNSTHQLEACEARRLINISNKAFIANKVPLFGKNFLISPRNLITGLAGYGYADSLKKKQKKSNNGCS